VKVRVAHDDDDEHAMKRIEEFKESFTSWASLAVRILVLFELRNKIENASILKTINFEIHSIVN